MITGILGINLDHKNEGHITETELNVSQKNLVS